MSSQLRLSTPVLRRSAEFGLKRSGVRRRIGKFVLPVATSLGLIAVAEALTRTAVLPQQLSSPSDVVAWLFAQVGHPELWIAVGHTLHQSLLGLLLGSAFGIVAGLIMGEFPVIQRLFHGVVEFARPIPVIVYLPLLILIHGAVPETAIFLVGVAVMWPMLYQTMYGVKAIDPLLKDSGLMFGLSPRQLLWAITIPSILPYLATGLRISMSLALIVAVAIELIAGVPGLGWDLTRYQTIGNFPAIYGVVVVSGALGVSLNALTLMLERAVLGWHVSYRSETS